MRLAVLAALASIGLAACDGGGAGARVLIQLDLPADDRDGGLLNDLEKLEFRVSDGRDFVASQVYRVADGLPDELSLPDVPTGSNILFDLTGSAREAEIAYGRTCRLSVDPSGGRIEARLYFSRVGRFRDGEDPLEPARQAGLMFSDNRGRAVVTGGSPDQLVELFDPREGQFSAAPGEAAARVGGAIAVREDGTAVLAGGTAPDLSTLVAAVEEINPISQIADEFITRLGPESQPEAQRTGLGLVALPDSADGSVLLIGGRTRTGAISGDILTLDNGDDEFRPVLNRAEEVVQLEAPRTGHATVAGLGGVVYVIGGLSVDLVGGGEVAIGSIELFRPQDASIRPLEAALAAPRFGHTASVLQDGRILIVGGKRPRALPCGSATAVDPETCFDAVSQVEVFDPIANEVRPADTSMPGGIPGGIYDHTATSMTGGRVLITGGFDGDGEPRDDAWLFDPDLEALVPTRELTRGRARHTATELCDGTVLLVGGESAGEEPLPAERYNPAAFQRDP